MTAENVNYKNEETLSVRQEDLRRTIFNWIDELCRGGKIDWNFTNSRHVLSSHGITGEYKGLSFCSTDIPEEGCGFRISLIGEDGNKKSVSLSCQDSERLRGLIIKSHFEALDRKIKANPDFYRILQEKKDAERKVWEERIKEQERKEQERDLQILSEVVSLLENQEKEIETLLKK